MYVTLQKIKVYMNKNNEKNKLNSKENENSL